MEGSRPTQALGSRYELEERLGVGAMGEVWRALDRHTGQHLAAKVLRAEFARDADIVTRFIQERSILLGLTHPNIVRVRDLVVEGERLAIVMDLVEGGDLRRHLRERGPVAPDHAVPLACVVLDALASAHESGCLHRDVKPDNVLLVEGDVTRPADARLSDFSIARLAQESTVQSTGLLGTPGYMPPELFRDGQFSAASDVYATGVMLYELLGGRTPFAGSGTAHTIGNRHVSILPPRLPVSDALWEVLERMLAKDPRARLRAAATAAQLRGLAPEALGATPLPVQTEPDHWVSAEQTVVRGPSLPPPPLHTEVRGSRASSGFESGSGSGFGPGSSFGSGYGLGSGSGLGTGSDASWSSSGVGHRPPPPPPEPVATSTPTRHRRRTWLPWGVGAAAVLLVAGSIAWAVSRDGAPASAEPSDGPIPRGTQAVSAQSADVPLPIGLTVARVATYDPASGNVDLTITYTASGAPLEGPFLEVLPAAAEGGRCPLAAWVGGEQRPTSTSATGIRPDCPAYVVDVPALDVRGREQVDVVVSGLELDFETDPDALQTWLDDVSAATTDALAESGVKDDQFPVQRTAGDLGVGQPVHRQDRRRGPRGGRARLRRRPGGPGVLRQLRDDRPGVGVPEDAGRGLRRDRPQGLLGGPCHRAAPGERGPACPQVRHQGRGRQRHRRQGHGHHRRRRQLSCPGRGPGSDSVSRSGAAASGPGRRGSRSRRRG